MENNQPAIIVSQLLSHDELSTDQSQESRIQVAESIGLISNKGFNFYYFILFNYTKLG